MRTASRHPIVRDRALALSESRAEEQIAKGIFTVDRGERFAIPVDDIHQLSDLKRGLLLPRERLTYQKRELWRQDPQGRVYRPGARMTAPGTAWQRNTLTWLRDHVHQDIPSLYYRAVLGHDLHVSTWGNLFGRHWHSGWANPFEPDRLEGPIDPSFETFFATHYKAHECRLGKNCPRELGVTLADLQALRGFVEDLGWLSGAKVTSAFVSEEIDELVSATGSEYADFDFHEVGTSNTAESNAHTALQTSTGIARATGTPTDADPIYQSVATITADTTETWQEHALFNNSTGPAMMDRSLTGGQSVVNGNQVQYTYQLTKNPEA